MKKVRIRNINDSNDSNKYLRLKPNRKSYEKMKKK